MVVTRARYVRKKPKKDNLIKKVINEVHNDYVTIKENGILFNVPLSDRVILRVINKNDTAVIDTDIDKVVDIINRKEKEILTPEEEQKELERQNQELEDLGWGDY